MQVKELQIPIVDRVTMCVYSSTTDKLYEVEDAMESGESRWQLVEGNEYDFEILDGESESCNWTIKNPGNIFTVNKKHLNRGKIKTGISVGTVEFTIQNLKDGIEKQLEIEIQSSKTEYRLHYRKMLTDIAEYYTDLVMQQGSPITQKFEVDQDALKETLYQKFAFVKGIVLSESFDASVHKVIINPVRTWTDSTVEKRVESVRRLSRASMRQISTRSNRVNVNGLPSGLTSLPRSLTVKQKVDTVDTHENQFVKFVIQTFYAFCNSLTDKMNASEQLKAEAMGVCKRLAEYLNNGFFRHISAPTRLNLGSPVLQRKEGYREILQAWLMFDLAAKIVWKGGDDVYSAGKKNIAALYEYWLFFKLLHVVADVFEITPKSMKELVKSDSDEISLNIRQGEMRVIEGTCNKGNRKLNVRLYYNRTFGFQEDVNKAGSWTVSMRPDYTLSIWPGNKTEVEAEDDNTIVHIHFDAKYRLEKILLDESEVGRNAIDSCLSEEKKESEVNIYKRGDLLKMHAYKDAIRRTVGAYVLYPGEKNYNKPGFHEILPGLGAFCISPGEKTEEQIESIKDFIEKVVSHMLDRTSQREKLAVASKKIHVTQSSAFMEPFPEPVLPGVSPDVEAFPEHFLHGCFPDTTHVLVGCYVGEQHRDWICKNGKYVMTLTESCDEAINLKSSYLATKYVLLYDFNSSETWQLYKVIGGGPKILPSQLLKEVNYPFAESGYLFMVFDICLDSVEEELKLRDWSSIRIANPDGKPVMVKYVDLFEPDLFSPELKPMLPPTSQL